MAAAVVSMCVALSKLMSQDNSHVYGHMQHARVTSSSTKIQRQAAK